MLAGMCFETFPSMGGSSTIGFQRFPQWGVLILSDALQKLILDGKVSKKHIVNELFRARFLIERFIVDGANCVD